MFFISYIFLMVVTIIIGFVSYISTLTTIRRSIEDYNLAMVQQTKTIIDEKMMTVEKAAIDIAFNVLTDRISNMTEIKDGESLFTASQLIQDINYIKGNNNFIKEIYIYFNNSNMVISDEGMFDSIGYYQKLAKNKNLTFEQWKNLYSIDAFRGYRPVKPLGDETEPEIITFQQSLSFYKTSKPRGSIVIVIDKSYIKALLETTNISNNGAILIYNSDNELMLTLGQKDCIVDIDQEKLNNEGMYQVNSKQGKLIISKVQSASTGWKYVSVIPISIYYRSVSNVKKLVIIITMIQVIFGCLVALLMSWKNYEPIKKSFQRIKSVFGYGEDVLESEYFKVVDEITSTTLKENNEIKDSMIKLQPLLKDDLLNQLFKGIGTDYNCKQIEENLKSVGINFITNKFCVCKVHIDDCSKFTSSSSIQERALTTLAITNTIERINKESYNIFSSDIDKENIAVLFNSKRAVEDSNLNLEEMYKDLVSHVQKSQRIIEENFSILISIGISYIHENIGSISLAFKEAEEALNYSMIRGFGSFIEFKETGHSISTYAYDMQTEMQLINYIKTGDSKNVHAILNEVFNRTLGLNDQPLDEVKCIFYDMSSTIIKLMDELHIDNIAIEGFNKNSLNLLLKCKNIRQMQSKLEDIALALCDYINSNKKSHNVELKEKFQKIILENYDKNYISLVWVAEELRLNPTYLSYLFKELMGETFTNYISKLRIDKGKTLLKETDYSLQKIAEQVGYTNSGVFIKVFKKFEGCTPGKYREAVNSRS